MTRASEILQLIKPDLCPDGLTPEVVAVIEQLAADFGKGGPGTEGHARGVRFLTEMAQRDGPESLRSLMRREKEPTFGERVARAGRQGAR